MQKLIFMKRNLLVFLMFCLPVLGFSQQYQAQRSYLSAGVGIGGYSDREGIPIWINYEYGFGSWVSAGGMLAFQTWEYNYPGIGTYSYTATFLALRGSAHFSKPLNIEKYVDLYAGLGLGYISYSEKWRAAGGGGPKPVRSGLSSNFLGIHVGARYFFNKTKTVGINGELGYGLSPLLLGVTFKF